jgi:ornithine decarboxylase
VHLGAEEFSMATASLLRFERPTARRAGHEPIYADAMAVARELAPEAPVFCFSAETLRATARAFIQGFPGEVSYAVKANSSRHVLETLAGAGLRVWDVASVQEMAMVRAVQPGAVFHYHNPIKSRAEIREAFAQHGCRRFAIDCREELDKIAAVTDNTKSLEIAVRFVLPRAENSSAHDFTSKFGADEARAAILLAEVVRRGHRPVLTFHPGSQCKDPKAYARHIAAAGRIARAAGVRLDVLNVGGGFPVDYVKSGAPDLEAFFVAIAEAARVSFGDDIPHLECEPGRAMVARSISLLTRVKIVRGGSDVFLNDGIYGALMEVSQVAELHPPFRAIRAGDELVGETSPKTVFGPTCDPLDVLPEKLELPKDIEEGDFIEFGTLGAYGCATMTRFNGYGGHAMVRVRDVLNLD